MLVVEFILDPSDRVVVVSVERRGHLTAPDDVAGQCGLRLLDENSVWSDLSRPPTIDNFEAIVPQWMAPQRDDRSFSNGDGLGHDFNPRLLGSFAPAALSGTKSCQPTITTGTMTVSMKMTPRMQFQTDTR